MSKFIITEEERNKILRMHNLLNEDESSALNQMNSILSSAGISLSQEEIDELKNGCFLDTSGLSPEEQKMAKEYENQTSQMTDEQAVDKLIELGNQQPLEEQGLTPQQTNVAKGFVGLWTLYLLIRIFRGLFKRKGDSPCRKINRRYKKRGIRGVTESK